MTLPVRLIDSGLSRSRQNQLKDYCTFNIEDPEYEVFKKGPTYYVSKRVGTPEADPGPGPKPSSKKIPADEPKSKPMGLEISPRDLLEQYAGIRKELADEKRKRKKLKAKFNGLHADIYRTPGDPLGAGQENSGPEAGADHGPDLEAAPEFLLKSRRRRS